jgi:S-formylglutathione hydrolase FrmB
LDIPLTEWWPVGTVLLVVGVLAVVAAVGFVHTTAARVGIVLVAVILMVGSGAAAVNAYYEYYRTLGEALGGAPPDEESLAGAERGRGRVPAQGRVVPVDIRGTSSGFAARTAEVYLPPAWWKRPRPALPVIVLLHGTPGSPTDWVEAGQAQVTADTWAAEHNGVGPVVVMPDSNGSFIADTECVDSPLGRVETYLTVDVPAAVQKMFGTQAPGKGWAVAGLSEGGSCAIMLALRHPKMFVAFGDFGGLAGPRVGDTNADTASTVAQLFGGSQQQFDAHEPASVMHGTSFAGLGGWFEVGSADAEPLAAAQQLAPLAVAAGVSTCLVVVPGGEHTWDVWTAAFRTSLPWLAARLRLVPATPAMTSSCRQPA